MCERLLIVPKPTLAPDGSIIPVNPDAEVIEMSKILGGYITLIYSREKFSDYFAREFPNRENGV